MSQSRLNVTASKLPAKSFDPPVKNVNYPSVCFNSKGTVVVLYQSFGTIYYTVGTANFVEDRSGGPRQLTMVWGSRTLYGDGTNVQAALNEDDQIVVVRSTKVWRQCMMRVGKVDSNSKEIVWQAEDTLTKGVNPAVALKGSTAILVHEGNYGLYHAYYNIAEITETAGVVSMKIVGDRDRRLEALDGCKEISVAVNADGWVVFSCRNFAGPFLYYAVGKLGVLKSLDDVKLCSSSEAKGYYSRIALLNNGLVMSIHEAAVPLGSTLYLRTGYLESEGRIEWRGEEEFDRGNEPSMAVCDNYTMVVVHLSGYIEMIGELKYTFCSIVSSGSN